MRVEVNSFELNHEQAKKVCYYLYKEILHDLSEWRKKERTEEHFREHRGELLHLYKSFSSRLEGYGTIDDLEKTIEIHFKTTEEQEK